jgi:hypothetical protein
LSTVSTALVVKSRAHIETHAHGVYLHVVTTASPESLLLLLLLLLLLPLTLLVLALPLLPLWLQPLQPLLLLLLLLPLLLLPPLLLLKLLLLLLLPPLLLLLLPLPPLTLILIPLALLPLRFNRCSSSSSCCWAPASNCQCFSSALPHLALPTPPLPRASLSSDAWVQGNDFGSTHAQ